MIASEAPPLRAWIRPERVLAEARARDAEAVLGELAGLLARGEPAIDERELLDGLRQRERLGSTAVGAGCAIPHARMPRVESSILAVARSADGIEFGSPDGSPVQLFFGLVAPSSPPGTHLRALAAVARWLRDPERRERLLSAPDAAAMFALLADS